MKKVIYSIIALVFSFFIASDLRAQDNNVPGNEREVSDDYKHPFNKVTYPKNKARTSVVVTEDENYKNQASVRQEKRAVRVFTGKKVYDADRNYKHQVPLKRE